MAFVLFWQWSGRALLPSTTTAGLATWSATATCTLRRSIWKTYQNLYPYGWVTEGLMRWRMQSTFSGLSRNWDPSPNCSTSRTTATSTSSWVWGRKTMYMVIWLGSLGRGDGLPVTSKLCSTCQIYGPFIKYTRCGNYVYKKYTYIVNMPELYNLCIFTAF